MKLITAQIEKSIAAHPIYSQEKKGKDAKALCKFFYSGWTWYVTEGNLTDGTLFGVVVNGYGEASFGYFCVDQLQSVRTADGYPCVERDIYFKPTKLSEIDDESVQCLIKRLYEK